jgi:hypothetical protein
MCIEGGVWPGPVHTWPSPRSVCIPILLIVTDDRFFSACSDNIRLWNAAEAGESEVRGRMQFKIIPGHHGGMVSQMRESSIKLRPDDSDLSQFSGRSGWSVPHQC